MLLTRFDGALTHGRDGKRAAFRLAGDRLANFGYAALKDLM
jgi:hypothetical protein